MNKMFISKPVLAIVVICLLIVFNVTSVYATTTTHDILNFSSSGCTYIYSNNPEQIDDPVFGSDPGKYTVSQLLTANQQYCAEYSHSNLSSNTIKLAILLCNTGSKNATVNVQKSNAVSFKPYSNYTNTAANFERDFANASFNNDTKSNAITVKANSVSIIASKEIKADFEAVGRAYFSTTSQNIYCKIVFYKSSYTGNELYIKNKATSKQSQATGVFSSTVKIADYDLAKASNKSFYLSAFQWNGSKNISDNLNEYDKGKNGYGCDYLYGNFGLYYFVNLKNAGGKTLTITPDWDAIHSDSPKLNEQNFILYVNSSNGDKWISVKAKYANKSTDGYSVKLPSNVKQIGYLLSANNNGNVKFTFK